MAACPNAPHCDRGSLPAIFAAGDHPCPFYSAEALVNPFDLPHELLIQDIGRRLTEAHAETLQKLAAN